MAENSRSDVLVKHESGGESACARIETGGIVRVLGSLTLLDLNSDAAILDAVRIDIKKERNDEAVHKDDDSSLIKVDFISLPTSEQLPEEVMLKDTSSEEQASGNQTSADKVNADELLQHQMSLNATSRAPTSDDQTSGILISRDPVFNDQTDKKTSFQVLSIQCENLASKMMSEKTVKSSDDISAAILITDVTPHAERLDGKCHDAQIQLEDFSIDVARSSFTPMKSAPKVSPKTPNPEDPDQLNQTLRTLDLKMCGNSVAIGADCRKTCPRTPKRPKTPKYQIPGPKTPNKQTPAPQTPNRQTLGPKSPNQRAPRTPNRDHKTPSPRTLKTPEVDPSIRELTDQLFSLNRDCSHIATHLYRRQTPKRRRLDSTAAVGVRNVPSALRASQGAPQRKSPRSTPRRGVVLKGGSGEWWGGVGEREKRRGVVAGEACDT